MPILGFLKQGMSAKKLALAVSLALIIGIVPLPWVSTLLCTAIALLFRLNLPVIQFVNQIVYPLQIALFVPFLKGGEYLLESPPTNLTIDQITEMIQSDVFAAAKVLWQIMLTATFSWSLLCVPLFFIVYFTLLPILKRYAKRKQMEEPVASN